MKKVPCVTAFVTMFLLAVSARADRIQLPHDPDITLGVGSGGFFGTNRKIDFNRIQPVFFRLELTAFKRNGKRWFNRLNIYCALSPEFANISYKGHLSDITVEDENGETHRIQKDGLERANLKARLNASGGCGIRQSVYDHPRFHIDAFGEFAMTTQKVSTDPETIIVSWSGLSLDVAKLAMENAEINLSWEMIHSGLTFGFPLSRWKGHRDVRLTPFFIVGFIHFKAEIVINVDENFLDELDRLGVSADIIPNKESVDVNNFTASVGMRLDIGTRHAFETAGSFFFNRAGTRVYWATVSYSIRFDLPW